MIFLKFVKWKQILAVFAAGCMLYLSGCTWQQRTISPQPIAQNAPSVPSDLPEDDLLGYRLLCTLPNMNSQTMTMIARGVQDRCDALGIDLTMHNSHDDHMSQAVEVDTFVKGGGQAILCSPVDNAALFPFLQLARQQGVKIIAWGEGVESDTSIAPDVKEAGRQLAKNAAGWVKGLDGRQPVAVFLTGEAPVPDFALGITDGYAEAMEREYATVETVSLEDEAWVETVAALIPKTGVVLADSDKTALMAREQLAEYWLAQKTPYEPDWSRYYFGGYGATPEGIEALRRDTLQATIAENGYSAGEKMVDKAVKLLQGGTAENQKITPLVVDKRNTAGYT